MIFCNTAWLQLQVLWGIESNSIRNILVLVKFELACWLSRRSSLGTGLSSVYTETLPTTATDTTLNSEGSYLRRRCGWVCPCTCFEITILAGSREKRGFAWWWGKVLRRFRALTLCHVPVLSNVYEGREEQWRCFWRGVVAHVIRTEFSPVQYPFEHPNRIRRFWCRPRFDSRKSTVGVHL